MRRLMRVVMVLFLCILAIYGGCTGIPGIRKAVSSGSGSTVSEPTGKAGNSWAGTFMTTWQGGGHDVLMELVQSGNSVTGTYEYDDGTITGTIQGNRLVGTWTESKGEIGGPVEFEMAQDGKTLAGWWDFGGADFDQTTKDDPSWTGIRVS